MSVYPPLEPASLVTRRSRLFPFDSDGLTLTHLGRGAIWLALRALGLGACFTTSLVLALPTRHSPLLGDRRASLSRPYIPRIYKARPIGLSVDGCSRHETRLKIHALSAPCGPAGGAGRGRENAPRALKQRRGHP